MPLNDDDPRFSLVKKELEASLERNSFLQKENEQLKQEVERLRKQLYFSKAQTMENKSASWSKVRTSFNTNGSDQEAASIQINNAEGAQVETSSCKPESLNTTAKERQQRIPKPPPRSVALTLPQVDESKKVPAAPPPPPAPPSKLQGRSANLVRRVPEVMEFYRSLTRRDTKINSKTSISATPTTATTRSMIGEIENRSTYLLAIKSDVETQGEFIRFLIKEVERACYKEIYDVEAFVKWLDGELSYLVDERAVLKHFPQWPEQKADAMREAAFNFRDLKNLESEVSSFRDNPKQPLLVSLKRMQTLQDRIERSVHSTERLKESASKKYREFQIPWEWMQENGLIYQLKLSSMRLAKEYMRRVAKELQTNEHKVKENLMRQGVQFGLRVHQFAGGFNVEAMTAFKELQNVIEATVNKS